MHNGIRHIICKSPEYLYGLGAAHQESLTASTNQEGQGVSRQITPGTQTELTLRLEISRRQFFQWHFVEKRRIPEVKQKMDELTRALTLAGYDYDFIAAETQWRSRSCHWNTLRKLAWKVEPHQKGEGLPVPVELANVPIWLEGDQDVGDWRKSRSNETHRSHVSAAEADEHQKTHRNKDHGNGHLQDVAVYDLCCLHGPPD
ncbi:MAG: hypothetical protein ASARMPREDX12_002095 [Alectoria sarmentosa]|nr:MAG: hypothetical protein ASARMPREDX12_002095 [Alectoria sarmentosa]